MDNVDVKYMRRALQLARCGAQGASPNPMVGAVVVTPSGMIAGEGFHRLCGHEHAEVNAVKDVYAKYGRKAQSVLRESTVYVTLEPCAHYGKTPPCAKLLVDEGVPRVVVGCVDRFSKVSGRGIAMLREAGVQVMVGMLEAECECLNRRFFAAHTRKRPWVTLKWAQSADGFLDVRRGYDAPAARFSSVLGSTLVHRLRSLHDAVMVGSETVLADRPRLDCRLWPGGRKPMRVALDSRGRVAADAVDLILAGHDVQSVLERLYEQGVTSVLVEGGAAVLNSFLACGIWDEARVEVSGLTLGDAGGVKAPVMAGGMSLSLAGVEVIDGNRVFHYMR